MEWKKVSKLGRREGLNRKIVITYWLRYATEGDTRIDCEYGKRAAIYGEPKVIAANIISICVSKFNSFNVV